jgi:hypothetical protein
MLGGVDIVGVDAAASLALAMPASASFLARCASFDFACSSARKSETARAAAALDGSFAAKKTGAGSIEVGEQGAAWICGSRRNRIARSAETESVQSERCRFFSPRVQWKFLRPRPTPQIS